MPVMVCVDGFILTHAVERVDIPAQADVDAYLPSYEPVQVSICRIRFRSGRWLGRTPLPSSLSAHYQQTFALRLISEFAAEFKDRFCATVAGCCVLIVPRMLN